LTPRRRGEHLRDWRDFITDERVSYLVKKYYGLNLPVLAIRKIFHDNAMHQFPGIESGTLGNQQTALFR
jgi:hypothetical protein